MSHWPWPFEMAMKHFKCKTHNLPDQPACRNHLTSLPNCLTENVGKAVGKCISAAECQDVQLVSGCIDL